MSLLVVLLFVSTQAKIACPPADCASISPASICQEGFCTNPFVQGCLVDSDQRPIKRVCSSADEGSTKNCSPNELDFPEIRLFPGNWESSMFIAWFSQIFLSEILRVPVTIETGDADKNMEFYSPKNDFDYPSMGYHWKALETASKLAGDQCPTSKLPSATSYKACAHAMLEVWPAGNTENIKNLAGGSGGSPGGGYGEIAGSIGGYGLISWYTFERVIVADPTLKSMYGFTDRSKMAGLFKRPISWYEYCEQSYGTCSQEPIDKDSGSQIFYKKGVYAGYFRADNCVENPTTCAGYIVNAPCDWSTFVDAQIKWTHPNGKLPLKTAGPRTDGGYSYGQMQQIFEAAGELNENILMWWWEPEAMLEKWKVNPKFKLTSIGLTDYTEECNENRPTSVEKCGTTSDARAGINSKSGCANPVELLTKTFSNGLREQLTAWTNLTRSKTHVQTPGHGFLDRLQIDTPFIKKVLYEWRWENPGGGYPSNLWTRDVVCRHIRNISETIAHFNPPGHPKIITEVLSPDDFIIFQIIFGIGIFLCLLLILLVQLERASPRIRASQPIFLQLILLGGALLFLSCVLELERASSEFVCHSVLWTKKFGWGFLFVPLLLKTYRLHAVFEGAKRLKRIQIKTSTLIIALCAWLLLVEGTVSLLESTLLDQSPSYVYVPDMTDSKHSGRRLHKHRICGQEGLRSENGGEQIAVVASLIGIVLNMLLVLAGVIMAIRTRNISSKFSESTQLVMIMYNSFLFSALAFVFSTLPNLSPTFFVRTNALLLGIGLTLNIMILFVPKFYNFGDSGDQQMNSLGGRKKNNTSRSNGSSAASNNNSGGGSGSESTTGNKNTTISTTNSQSNTEYTAAKHEDTKSSLSNAQSSGEEKNTVVEMVHMNDNLAAAAVVHY